MAAFQNLMHEPALPPHRRNPFSDALDEFTVRLQDLAFEKRNKCLLMCIAHDIEDRDMFNSFQDACDSGVFRMPDETLRDIKANYAGLTMEEQIQREARKYRAIAFADYMESCVADTIQPLVNDELALVLGYSGRGVVAIPNVTFPAECKEVLLVFDDLLSTSYISFPVFEGHVYPQANGVMILYEHGDPGIDQNFRLHRRVTVFVKPKIRQLEQRLRGIKALREDEIVQQKMHPTGPVIAASVNYVNVPAPNGSNLNFLQRQAIVEMCHLDPGHPYVLHGPPGTGKTKTEIELVNAVYRDYPKQKILVLTHTNAAADGFTERLLRRGIIPPNQIIRVMATSRSPADTSALVNSVTLVEHGEYKIPKIGDFVTKKIVISTVASAERFHGVGKGYFRKIVFEEASQIPEIDVYGPLGSFCDRLTQLYFCGDPEQLAPIVISRSIAKLGYAVNVPTILRLARLALYRSGNIHYLIMLLENYRSNRDIRRLYSELTYFGRLVQAYQEPLVDSLANAQIIDKKSIPIRFHISVAAEVRTAEGTVYNLGEVALIIRYVNQALEEGVRLGEIGVITPYRGQVEQARQALLNTNPAFEEIMVDTVEGFQGLEKRVIIASLVRSEDIGFLQDRRRLNTTISRAKNLLILIGNPFVLLQTNLGGHKNYCLRLVRWLMTWSCFYQDSVGDDRDSMIEAVRGMLMLPPINDPTVADDDGELEDAALAKRTWLQ